MTVDFSGGRSRAMTRYGLPVATLAASWPLATGSRPSCAARKSTIAVRWSAASCSAFRMSRSRVTLAASTIVPLRS
jgi:hypothetical protein